MPGTSSGSVKIFLPPYSREELIALLRERIAKLSVALSLARVVLFGSWAAGRATAFSDVDILVVYRGAHRDDAYALVRRTLKLRGLEPHVYSEQQAAHMSRTLERMTAKGIPLLE